MHKRNETTYYRQNACNNQSGSCAFLKTRSARLSTSLDNWPIVHFLIKQIAANFCLCAKYTLFIFFAWKRKVIKFMIIQLKGMCLCSAL